MPRDEGSPAVRALAVSSPALRDGGSYPLRYTCSGANVSPPIVWSGVPARARAIGVALTDPDAPGGEFTHWVIYNLPPTLKSLPEGVASRDKPPCGGLQLRNDFGNVGYGGPCPPPGPPHRYVLRVYAVDRMLPPGDSLAVIAALRGHALAVGSLTGRFGR